MDWTTRHSPGGVLFRSRRYSDWPSLAEDLGTGSLGAAFLLAPMAMSLKQRGVPVRIVYLGHRDGTALMAREGSGIRSPEDLRGKRILVPSRYSNQYIWIARMARQMGIPLAQLDLRDCPPPDMPAMLETGAADAYAVGEPHAARTEIAGTGRVLALTKDDWPGFISCVLVVREDLIRNRRALVQELVDGIAGSGLWLDSDPRHRTEAAEVAGRQYFNQDPRLLAHVLSTPVDRVRYTRLSPYAADLDEIMELSVELGILREPIRFQDYCDPSFADAFDGIERPMPPWAPPAR